MDVRRAAYSNESYKKLGRIWDKHNVIFREVRIIFVSASLRNRNGGGSAVPLYSERKRCRQSAGVFKRRDEHARNVDGLSDDFRILLFDYPQELRTNQELVTGMHAFLQSLGIEAPNLANEIINNELIFM